MVAYASVWICFKKGAKRLFLHSVSIDMKSHAKPGKMDGPTEGKNALSLAKESGINEAGRTMLPKQGRTAKPVPIHAISKKLNRFTPMVFYMIDDLLGLAQTKVRLPI